MKTTKQRRQTKAEETQRIARGCCKECWYSPFSLSLRMKGGVGCGLSCQCHMELVESLQQSKEVVAIVDKHKAIDFTPVYYLQFTKTVEAGSVARFDSSEVFVLLETRGGKA